MEFKRKGNNKLEFVNEYIVVDVETTGLDSKTESIIEIAALRVKDGEVVELFESLINPGYLITPFITELTGITNDMLQGEKSAAEVLIAFHDFAAHNVIVGHNVAFDIGFIHDSLFKETGLYFSNDYIDTLRWARILIKDTNTHKLGHLASHLNLNFKPSHRAMTDCLTTFELYEYLKRKNNEKKNYPHHG